MESTERSGDQVAWTGSPCEKNEEKERVSQVYSSDSTSTFHNSLSQLDSDYRTRRRQESLLYPNTAILTEWESVLDIQTSRE